MAGHVRGAMPRNREAGASAMCTIGQKTCSAAVRTTAAMWSSSGTSLREVSGVRGYAGRPVRLPRLSDSLSRGHIESRMPRRPLRPSPSDIEARPTLSRTSSHRGGPPLPLPSDSASSPSCERRCQIRLLAREIARNARIAMRPCKPPLFLGLARPSLNRHHLNSSSTATGPRRFSVCLTAAAPTTFIPFSDPANRLVCLRNRGFDHSESSRSPASRRSLLRFLPSQVGVFKP